MSIRSFAHQFSGHPAPPTVPSVLQLLSCLQQGCCVLISASPCPPITSSVRTRLYMAEFAQSTTEMRFNLCRSCLPGPRQGQAEQLSKSRKKFHSTTYKDVISSLYIFDIALQSSYREECQVSDWVGLTWIWHVPLPCLGIR